MLLRNSKAKWVKYYEIQQITKTGFARAKISDQVEKQDIKGLIAFCEEHSPKHAYVISQDPRARLLKINDNIKITILPWQEFLNDLWDEKII